jgi:hypothetical protein
MKKQSAADQAPPPTAFFKAPSAFVIGPRFADNRQA